MWEMTPATQFLGISGIQTGKEFYSLQGWKVSSKSYPKVSTFPHKTIILEGEKAKLEQLYLKIVRRGGDKNMFKSKLGIFKGKAKIIDLKQRYRPPSPQWGSASLPFTELDYRFSPKFSPHEDFYVSESIARILSKGRT